MVMVMVIVIVIVVGMVIGMVMEMANMSVSVIEMLFLPPLPVAE